jgi:ribosome-interacting GTPase 1
MLEHHGARIQILDLPGIIAGASSGRGLGKRVLSVVRSADLVLFIVDVFQPEGRDVLIRELNNIGIRVDQKPPNVVIERTNSGGLSVSYQTKPSRLSEDLTKDILRVYEINSGRVFVREDISDDQLVDVILQNRVYLPSLTVMNKIDLVNAGFTNELSNRLSYKFVPVSS